jgi:hypothetical protein
MSRYWLIAVGAGLLSALMYALLTTGTPLAFVLAYFVQLPIFLAGLGLGALAGAGAGAVGLVALVAVDGVLTAALYLTVIFPALVLVQRALLARRSRSGDMAWYPPGLLATWLAGMALAALAAAMLALVDHSGGLEGAAREAVRAILNAMPFRIAEDQAALEQATARILPGMVLFWWMLITILNGGVAQGLLMRAGRNIRPAVDIAELELPRLAPIALAGALGLAVFGDGWLGFFGVNAVAIIALPFFLAGLAVVHAMARPRASRRAILAGFYVLFFILFILFRWPAIMLAGLGLIEQWAHLRRRFLAQA